MPTYQYVCTNPDEPHEFERVQSFSDAAISECPICGAPVRKRYGSVGVVFKGSGFYRNDSRGGTSSSDVPKSDAKSDGAKSDSKSDASSSKSDSKSDSSASAAKSDSSSSGTKPSSAAKASASAQPSSTSSSSSST